MTIILFDYGGVLSDHHFPEAEAELSNVLGVDVPTVRALLSEKSEQGRLIREGRLSEVGFWSRVASLAGLDYLPAPAHVLTDAWCRTYTPNARLFKAVAQLRSFATTGVVTNIDPYRSKYLTDNIQILDLIDLYYPSFQFGYTKQAPQFWSELKQRIDPDLMQSRVMYVDDRNEHIESAVNVGFSGYRYDGDVGNLVQALTSWIECDPLEGISE